MSLDNIYSRVVTKNSVVARDSAEGDLFHGQDKLKKKKTKIRAFVDSTAAGESLPDAWDKSGKIAHDVLAKGCTYSVASVGSKEKVEKVCKLDNIEPYNAFFEAIADADHAVQSLHSKHIQQGTQSIDIETMAQNFKGENFAGALPCRAIINMPSTGFDVVGKSAIVMTKISDEGRNIRRLYFIMVSLNF